MKLKWLTWKTTSKYLKWNKTAAAALPCALPTIDTSGIFLAHISGVGGQTFWKMLWSIFSPFQAILSTFSFFQPFVITQPTSSSLSKLKTDLLVVFLLNFYFQVILIANLVHIREILISFHLKLHSSSLINGSSFSKQFYKWFD